MKKRLSDNISSAYIEAANRLGSKSARRRIVAYVESYDDVFFWRAVLASVEDDKTRFEVMLPTRKNKLERGKKAAISRLLTQVGRDMIACVDADYDYLEQGCTYSSKAILSNPYIFHTYAYAIENLQCFAPSLHDVCVAVTLNDRRVFDFETFLADYSRAIYPLFVWNVWFYRTPEFNKFSITDFLRVIETGNISMHNASTLIDRVKHKVDIRVRQLEQHYPAGVEAQASLRENLSELGVTPETTYLFIQGHHLFDKVIVPLMKKVCDNLVRNRENEISRQSQHSAQRNNELSCYTSSITGVTTMLRRNVGFLRSEQFAWIRRDLSAFIAGLEKEKTET